MLVGATGSKRVAVAIAVALGACGRIDFAPRPIDAAVDAVPTVPRFVAMGGGTSAGSTTSLAVSFPTVVAGDLLIVAIAEHQGATITSVVDSNGTQLVSAGARAAQASTASDLWYEANAAPTNRVTVAVSSAGNFDVWVAEFAGVKPGPPDRIAAQCLQYPPAIVTAPGVATVAEELVFSVTMLAFPLFVSDVQPPFTGFPPRTGNDAGYYVVPQAGSYATTFDISMGAGMPAMTCASTAVWPPGP